MNPLVVTLTATLGLPDNTLLRSVIISLIEQALSKRLGTGKVKVLRITVEAAE